MPKESTGDSNPRGSRSAPKAKAKAKVRGKPPVVKTEKLSPSNKRQAKSAKAPAPKRAKA